MIKSNWKKITAVFMLTAYMITTAGASFCITNAPNNINLRQPAETNKITLEGDTIISTKNPKISLSLRDADVVQILRMFADKAGKNIVFHKSALTDSSVENNNTVSNKNDDDVTHNPINYSTNNDKDKDRKKEDAIPVNLRATLDMVNVPLNDAFKMVLKVSGLTYYLEGNTIVVLSQQEAKISDNIIRKELRSIPIKYVDASGLARFLNKNVFTKNRAGLSNQKVAATNSGANELLIMGTENDYLLAKKIVEQYDKKPLEETFALNHTTPREMAYLLCEVLFKNLKLMQAEEDDDDDTENDEDANDNSDSNDDNENIDIVYEETTDSEEKTMNDIVLGRGLIACQYNNRIKTSALQSLHTGGLTVAYFATKGTVSVIGASAEQMDQVRDFIKEKDTKQLQAFLELSIIELTESGSKSFYNTWNLYTNFLSASFSANGMTSTTNPIFLVGDTAPNGTKFDGQKALNYTIQYLIDNKKGKVLSNPKIIVTNGEKSVINITKDYVKTVQSEVLTDTLAGATNRTITLGEDMGIKVELSPFISHDGYITLNIKPEYSTELEKVRNTETNDIEATLLSKRNLDLRGIRLKDGETLVIGGMIADEEHKEVWKVPLLGDIPGIGALFRSSNKTREKNELIIMVTPRIITDSEDVVNNTNGTGTAL